MTDHSRTVTWRDPADIAPQLMSLSGLEAIRAMQAEGVVPPLPALLGIEGVSVDEGCAEVAIETGPHHANGTGGAHGGLAASALDSAMWLALHSTLPAKAFCSTLQLNVHYTRAVPLDGRVLTARGTAVHGGRTTATASGELVDDQGRTYAHATTHCLVQRFG